MEFSAIFKLIRIKHWIKNALLFFPIVFSGRLMETELALRVGIGTFAFCLVASAVYILNDIKDRLADRHHPTKRFRPIASGKVNPGLGLLIATLLSSGGFAIALALDLWFVALLGGYVVLNVAYSFWLKNVGIIDITIIALGFLIRIFSGGVLAGIFVSHWLVLLTFLLALFLAIAKRRDDLLLEEHAETVRKNISKNYSFRFIDMAMAIFSAVIIVSYIMYTISPEVIARVGTEYIYLTTLPVVVGMLRYLQITIVGKMSRSPVDVLYKDVLIQSMMFIWLLSFVLILYLL